MKKYFLYKISVLVAMMFLSITACQNEDAALYVSDEPTQTEYDALINTLKNRINGAIDTRVAIVTETLNADKERFAKTPNDVSLQKSILASAIEIEASKIYKSSAVELVNELSLGDPSDCDVSELEKLLEGSTSVYQDFYLRDIIFTLTFNWEEFPDFTEIVDLEWNKVFVFTQSFVDKLNDLILKVQECDGKYDQKFSELYETINDIKSVLYAHICLIDGILGIEEGQSNVLADIYENLDILDDIKANKFDLNNQRYDLITVYEELQDSLAVHRTDITNLQRRVKYIEEVEIPAIWEGMEFLYDFISDVYSNLDQRVTGLTFKPEYDFGGGLSNLILVRGLSEWESKTIEGGFGWQQKETGSVYKGVTWLTYNVSPANAKIDFETLELVYTTTKIITRSNGDPLLKILKNDATYPISYTNGVLTIPVVINEDAYPLVATSYDVNASENIKVALKLKNEGYTPGAMPVRPEETPNNDPTADTEDRSVVSSEYVTVWLGLFDGRIAEKDVTKTDNIGLLFPTEIITADFINKDNNDYPTLTLWAGAEQTNLVNVADSIIDVYYDGFEKAYRLPADYEFNEHNLLYELVDLGNSANNYIELTGSTVKIKSGQTNEQQAIGKTVCVLVKAKVGNDIHAVGYVRILVVRPDKETVTIETPFTLDQAVLNCGDWKEFTTRNTVSTLVTSNILNNDDVKEKTGISSASVFYSKYKGTIEVNSVDITATNNAVLPTLTDEQLKELVQFNYVIGNPSYIKGTISNLAPFGEYTLVTTLKSEELIPDLVVTWKFTIATPQLRPSTYLVNNTYVVTSTVSAQNTAVFSGLLDQVFMRDINGKFLYNSNSLSGNCPDYITPDFLFAEVPTGYDISTDGKTILKSGVEAAKIVTIDGKFYVQLIEGTASHGLINNPALKIIAKGYVNDGKYTTYQPFSIVFTNPIKFSLPSNAVFTYNLYVLDLYKLTSRTGSDIIYTYDNQPISLVMNKENTEILINRYGIDYTYDQSFKIGNKTISSPLKFDLDNITYASGTSNDFSNNLSSTNATVTLSIQEGDDFAYYNLNTPKRYAIYFNKNGETFPNNLRISIPVTIQHRWGITQENLIIKVN